MRRVSSNKWVAETGPERGLILGFMGMGCLWMLIYMAFWITVIVVLIKLAIHFLG